jgi:hypothetical protein
MVTGPLTRDVVGLCAMFESRFDDWMHSPTLANGRKNEVVCLFERDGASILVTYSVSWLVHAGTRKVHGVWITNVDVETKDGDCAWGVHGDANAGWALADVEPPFTEFDRVTIAVESGDEEDITKATGVVCD